MNIHNTLSLYTPHEYSQYPSAHILLMNIHNTLSLYTTHEYSQYPSAYILLINVYITPQLIIIINAHNNHQLINSS